MTMRLVDRSWSKEFTESLLDDSSELRIICPFIKSSALQRLLRHQPGNVQVITRFNLADFADGVSDIAALRKLLEAGVRVRGVRNLHAKLYLFGKSRAIIASCNLTEAALGRNHELGMVIHDWSIIEKAYACLPRHQGPRRRRVQHLALRQRHGNRLLHTGLSTLRTREHHPDLEQGLWRIERIAG